SEPGFPPDTAGRSLEAFFTSPYLPRVFDPQAQGPASRRQDFPGNVGSIGRALKAQFAIFEPPERMTSYAGKRGCFPRPIDCNRQPAIGSPSRNRLPAKRAFGLGFLEPAVELLAGDVGIFDHHAAKRRNRKPGHHQVHHDNHAKEAHQDDGHVFAAEVPCHVQFPGAVNRCCVESRSSSPSSATTLKEKSCVAVSGGAIKYMRNIPVASAGTSVSTFLAADARSIASVHITAPGNPSMLTRIVRGRLFMLRSLTV